MPMYVMYRDDEKLRYAEPTVLELLQVASVDDREDDFQDIGFKGDVSVFDNDGWVEHWTLHGTEEGMSAAEYKDYILEESGMPEVLTDGQHVVLVHGRNGDEYFLCGSDADPVEVAEALTKAEENQHVYRIVEE